ncbi:MAG: HmuY family protein [Bacteroidales bacterium]|jgi:hypothetical protein|nr:HmuY family protein [Bacteroidales bacterium]
MNKISKVTLLIFLLAGMASCDIDHIWDKDYLFEYMQPQDGVFVYDCSSYTTWHYFSFAAGGIIGSCQVTDTIATEVWRNRTDWDLAFHRQNIKTNSGVSGVGMGGILKYPQDNFDFDAVVIAPEEGYQTDMPDSIVYDLSQMAAGIIGYAHTGLAQPVRRWAVLTDMMSSLWTYMQNVFIVRTADGKYAKIYLNNFKSDIGVSGTVTMQYVYQPDGSVNLKGN